MHFRMSYIGSIAVLMAGSGIKEILEKAFGEGRNICKILELSEC